MQVANKIQNFATEEELVLWTTALTSANSHIINDNDCHGVSEDHILYDWFVANCFEKIKSVMDDDKLKVMFGMYLNETQPWSIHTDAYHVIDYPGRQTAKSFLMPLSVDNNVANSCVPKTPLILEFIIVDNLDLATLSFPTEI